MRLLIATTYKKRERKILMIEFNVAFDKLSSFQTSDEIADYFIGEGVQGYRQEEDSCPIAKWMQQTTNEAVYVTDTQAFIYDDDASSPIRLKEESPLSPAMKEFVGRFDGGDYPELSLDWLEEQFWEEHDE